MERNGEEGAAEVTVNVTADRIAEFEIDRRSGAYEWLLERPEVLAIIKEYLTKGGTLKAVHRCLVSDYNFPYSHSRLDATVFRLMPRPRR